MTKLIVTFRNSVNASKNCPFDTSSCRVLSSLLHSLLVSPIPTGVASYFEDRYLAVFYDTTNVYRVIIHATIYWLP